MVKPVDRIVPDFAKAGANIISFHPEASEHIDRTLQLIRDNGCKAGLVFNPATPLDYLDLRDGQARPDPDHVGQPGLRRPVVHSRGAARRSREARARIDARGRDIQLEVDGGVKVDNIARDRAAGADTFVAGSAIFGTAGLQGRDRRDARQLAQAESARTMARADRHPRRHRRPRRHHARHVPDFHVAINGMLKEPGPADSIEREQIALMVGKGSENLIRSRAGPAIGRGRRRAAFRRGDGRLSAPLPGHQRRPQHVVPGVIAGLTALKANGLRLACVTNKPIAFAAPLLEHKGLDGFFERRLRRRFAAASKKPDPLPLQNVCADFDLPPAQWWRSATRRTTRKRRGLRVARVLDGALRLQPRTSLYTRSIPMV